MSGDTAGRSAHATAILPSVRRIGWGGATARKAGPDVGKTADTAGMNAHATAALPSVRRIG